MKKQYIYPFAIVTLLATAGYTAPAVKAPRNPDAAAIDSNGNPAIVAAAIQSNAQAIKKLIDQGADVNAKAPSGATALLYAAGDFEKAKLLIDAGADVNAASLAGRTPLHVAASVAGGASIVKLLLAKGAKVDVKDNIPGMPILPAGGGKATPLIEASRVGDLESVRLLIAAGADVNAADSRNGTALAEAVVYGRRDIVRLLIDKGASATGTVSMLKFPMMTLAAMRGDEQIAKMLLNAGAEVSKADATGGTPLMWAAFSDHINTSLVEYLLKAGADPKATNKAGESALDWARQRGDTAVTRILAKAGAPSRTASPAAELSYASSEVPVTQTLDLLAKGAEASMKKTGCASCHHHTLPLVAFSTAKRNGHAVNEEGQTKMLAALNGMTKPMAGILLEGSNVPPDMPVTGSYILEAFAAQNKPADMISTAIVHNVMQQQMADGRWLGWSPRVPLEGGDIQATALAIRSLKLYPIAGRQEEINTRVNRAAKWLRTARPVTTEEFAMRLLGFYWSETSPAEVKAAAKQLAALQREDGGWAQLPALSSDAYATGKSVFALRTALGEQADSAGIRNGIAFLRKTQLADGTWFTKTRAFPFQPLVDTGLPHGRDQWISAAATSWALIALMPAL